MTREEALDELELLATKKRFKLTPGEATALDMAIKALEQETNTGHWISYNQGWKDCQDMSIKINNENEKAMKLHKETDCPLFSCIEAIKTDDPIKYLQGKSKLQG